MPYRLKPGQEAFEVVDGAYAGRKFEKNTIYDDIPSNEAARFDTESHAGKSGSVSDDISGPGNKKGVK